MTKPVRVGVIGCDSVARKYIPILQRLNLPRPRVEIALVCGVDPAQRAEAAEGYAIAVVATGFTIQKYRAPGIELYGTAGTIQMIGEDWAPKGYELWRNAAGCWQTYDDASHWPWADGARHLIECIEREQRPVITPEHAYHALEIMIKTMASGRTGQALPIESTFTPPRFPDADLLDRGAHLAHDPGRAE